MTNGISQYLPTAATLACGLGSSVAALMLIGPENMRGLEGNAALIGGIAYSVLYCSGMGERSHRYLGGAGLQVVTALVTGMYADANSSRYHAVSFNLPGFFVATTISLIFQTACYEAASRFSSSLSGRATKVDTGDADLVVQGHVDHPDSSDGADGSGEKPRAVILRDQQKGDEVNSALVPTLGQVSLHGMKVASAGSLIVGMRRTLEEEKDLFRGNTRHEITEYDTAEGGKLTSDRFEHSGWTGSRRRHVNTYKAGGAGGMGHVKGSRSDGKTPIVEVID